MLKALAKTFLLSVDALTMCLHDKINLNSDSDRCQGGESINCTMADLANYIAERVWQASHLRFADPREPVRISRLARSKDDVEKVLKVMGRYSPPMPLG